MTSLPTTLSAIEWAERHGTGPTRRELSLAELTPEQTRDMAELSLLGFRFVAGTAGRWLVYAPDGTACYKLQRNGNQLPVQVNYAKRYRDTGEQQ